MIRVGDIVQGRYEILQRIGMGGMADVYKAKDNKLGRLVAFKVLKAEFSSDKSFVAKFQAEARAAAGLSHPNIVNVYDVSEEGGSYFIIMELVEGITLKNYIEKKGKLSFKETVSIAIPVATGIEAAHNNNIIHRDIKPQNIIISTDGKVKIADFGIAKAINANTNTITSNVMGSVHYSSPEQSRGGYLDAKSDIYSLGIVMYEMVTGRVPFDGDTTVSVAIQHLQEQIVPPSRYVDIPRSFEDIILKCTQKSPELRYNNAGELIADLKQSLITPDADFVVFKEVPGSATSFVSSTQLNEAIGESGRLVAKSDNKNTGYSGNGRNNMKKNKKKTNKYNDNGSKAETVMGIITIVAAIAIIIIIIMIIWKINGSSAKLDNKENKTDTELVTNDLDDNEDGEENPNEEVQDGEEFDIPDVIGSNLADATKIMENKGLSVIGIKDENAVGQPNVVVRQNPDVGSKVKKGDTVELHFIPEEAKEVIPAGLTGMGEEEAADKLKDLGFVVRQEFAYDNKVENGKVISISPEENSELEKGSIVKLTISKGKEEIQVPTVLGMTKKEAKKALADAGLVLGEVKENLSDKYEEGKVMQQTPKKGSLAAPKSKVDIVISLGVQDVDENIQWHWSNKLSEPADYTGSDVRVIVEQSDGMTTKSNVVWDDKPLDFDNYKFNIDAVIPGVVEGKLYVYEKKQGEYQLLGTANIKFSPVN